MYKCHYCGKSELPGRKRVLVVIERDKVYPARPAMGDPGGKGRETMQERPICRRCQAMYPGSVTD